jgi:hypothetical protein
MTMMRSGGAVWLVRGKEPRRARRAGAAVLARAGVVLALILGACFTLLPDKAPAVAGHTPVPVTLADAGKDATRLESWTEARLPAPTRPAAPATTVRVAEPWRILDRRPASPALARFGASPDVTGSLTPAGFRAPTGNASGWREQEFAQVEALDGRTLAAPALRIRLSGLALPPADQVCRTLDGRLEPCAARAATQLALMTRHRKVACRYRLESTGEAVGTCRLGDSDLAERLVRTGYVKRTGPA